MTLWDFSLFYKVKELKANSFKKMSALSEASKNPGDMKVSMQRSHHLQDEEFTEVEDEHVTKGINTISLI